MRESCSCGAFIQTIQYRRVKAWRTEHQHTPAEPDEEPDKQGAEARVEHAGQREYEYGSNEAPTPIVIARIGFTPNN